MVRWAHDSSWVFNLAADVYAWMNDQPTWRASCARLADYLPETGSETPLHIVDLGCGPGTSAIALARLRPKDHVVGMDLARRMLLEAQHRLRQNGLTSNRVPFVRGDAARLPFRTASVDAATGHSFLYLLPRRAAALAEARRILRPGGRLILMEPNAQRPSIQAILRATHDPRMLLSITLWRPFSRLHGQFTAVSLAQALQEAGFGYCHLEEVLGGLGLLAWTE